MSRVPAEQVDDEAHLPRAAAHGIWFVTAVMIAVGLVARIAPLLDFGGRLLRQFPTEDGYLMLTIARNMALGRGMSISDGTIPTNGTQPLATAVWSVCFRLAHGDKSAGVALVLWLSVLVAILSAWLLYRLGRKLLVGWHWGAPVAALAASTWFASSASVRHSMNCLETGIYALIIIICSYMFINWTRSAREDWSIGRCLLLGIAFGLAFWSRNDAVFFVAAACLTRLATGLGGGFERLRRRVLETFVFGAVSVLVAIPWLINNVARFGHLVPISGIAESREARFAANLYLVPVSLLEYLSVIVGVPMSLEDRWPLIAACTAIVLCAGALWVYTYRKTSEPIRSAILLVGLYTLFLSGYYGLLFGAPYFMSRYLMPVSPFMALWSISLLAVLWTRTRHRGWMMLASPAAILALAIVVLTNARVYRGGSSHMHFQVKDWIDANVPEDVWVGATQSGTIGFFHDRTLNLDGKVSPLALEANLKGTVFEYIIASPIQYLADWAGIASWSEQAPLSKHFELIVDDQKANLAVLRRKRIIATNEARP
jgi:hypothetical protein